MCEDNEPNKVERADDKDNDAEEFPGAHLLTLNNLSGDGSISFNKEMLLNSWLLKATQDNWKYEKKVFKEVLGGDDWEICIIGLNVSILKKYTTNIIYHDVFIYDKRVSQKDDQPFSGKIDNIPFVWTQVFFAKSLYHQYMFICNKKDMDKFVVRVKEIVKDEDIDLPYDKIILADGIKEKFEKSTFGFLENEELHKKFKEHRMRFKRCLLLHGSPGNGKSTLVTWLRARAEQKEWKVFNWENMSGDSFRYRDKMQKTLFILEDIDSVMSKRDETIYNSKGLGFSNILNLLDGSERMDNYIVVMTTNFPDLLDKALLRDGRVDEKIHIDYPTKELKLKYIDIMIKTILPDLDINKLDRFINNDKVAFSTLDNLRKKIFIYESLDKALETFDLEEQEEKKSIGFAK